MVEQWRYSVWLILGIVALFFINMVCIPLHENDMIFWTVLICPLVMLLLGGYIFTYRGRKHLVSKVVFTIFLLLSILSIWSYFYMLGMAAAFKN